MPYQQTTTQYVVRLVTARGLSPATLVQCQALRAEAGRLWTDLVTLHAHARAQGRWLGAGELEQAAKGGQYALHSQRVQALCQKVAANLETATELRRREWAESGPLQTQSPHHPKAYQTVIWKDQALQVLPNGVLRLPVGGQRPPLLPLPAECQTATVRRAELSELTWRADHYELCLTLDTGASLPPPIPTGESAGIDLGAVHVAALTTTRRHALVLSGRQVRSCKQWRNKVHSVLQEKLSRCQPGSRQTKRLRKRTAQVSAKLYRQQRDILHQAARKVGGFCASDGVTHIAVGDGRDIQTGCG
jgi:putative transposase